MQNSPVDPGSKAEESNLSGHESNINEDEFPGNETIPEIFETTHKGGGKGGLNEEGNTTESEENSAGGNNSGLAEETDSAGGSAG